MHIAVCDDNIADRKQMERLLGRASDNNKAKGLEGYFIDSYGNVPSLMQTPQMYDAIFIDMVDSDITGLQIAANLRDIGVVGQIILCSSRINYKENACEAELTDYKFMDKPIKVSELQTILDFCEMSRADKVPMIELRSDSDTIYVHHDEILHAAYTNGSTGRVKVTLTDDRTVFIMSSLPMFYKDVEDSGFIKPVSDNAIVNVKHIAKIGMLTVIMDDGTKYVMARNRKAKIKEAYASFR